MTSAPIQSTNNSSPLDITIEGSGPPLLLISGMFAGGWLWDHTLDELRKHYTIYRTTEALCEISGNIDELYERVASTIKQLNIGPMILSGASLGGIISVFVAARYPELCRGVIVCGSPGSGMINLGIGMPKRVNLSWGNALRDKIMFDPNAASEEDFIKIYSLFENRKTFRNIIQLARGSAEIDVDKLLGEINCPACGIWGASDEVTPLAHWSSITEKHAFNINVIPNAGHVPMYESPELFVKHMREFIAHL